MSMRISTSSAGALEEKTRAAGSSVLAALFLTALKIIVGLATNSLGILAEAAHSALYLGAALMTLFAVRVSDRLADIKHPYGHARVENLSALFETLLLLITCVWIVWESVRRLFLERETVEASIWAFLVMVVSIIVDVSRSRMLRRAARKHDSQALEADAVHFETDIWSSSVVLLGLVGVWVAQRQSQLAWLENADAVAALGVAVIVIGVSIRLGGRAVRCLLDGTEPAVVVPIRAAIQATAGVKGVHRLRVRTAGPETFVDVHVLADRRASLWDAHTLADAVQKAVRAAAPRTDIVVHVEPVPPAAPNSIGERVPDADR